MRKLAVFFLFVLMFNSCKKDQDLVSKNFESSETEIFENLVSSNENIELGDKQEDPHLLRHVIKAQKDLATIDSKFDKITITANYKYVKITPLNYDGTEEINRLSKDYHVFYFPMDRKVIKHGEKYEDPEKINEFTSCWVVLPIGMRLTENCTVKNLEELFMPFGNANEYLEIKDTELASLYRVIEEKAYQNLNPTTKKGKINVTYSGSLAVEEDSLSDLKFGIGSSQRLFLPIKNVTIIGRRNLTSRATISDNLGNFTIPYNFAGNVDEYTIVWETGNFFLVNNLGISARDSYTSSATNTWHAIFYRATNQRQFRFAHVHRAANNYFNIPETELKRPPMLLIGPMSTCIPPPRLKIKVQDGGQSHFYGANSVLCKANIVIENTNTISNSEFKAWRLYASTVHEMSHAKHWNMSGVKYCFTGANDGALAESYAMLCEYFLVNREYSSIMPSPYAWNSNFYDRRGLQLLPITHWQIKGPGCFNTGRFYTPYFIDLMDSRNQGSINILFPNENISGFSAKTLEDAVYANPASWASVNTYIKTHTSGATNATATNIDALYNLYNNNL